MKDKALQIASGQEGEQAKPTVNHPSSFNFFTAALPIPPLQPQIAAFRIFITSEQ